MYQPGFTRCSDCLIDLVEPAVQAEAAVETPAQPGREARTQAPICVYRSRLRRRMPFAELLLGSAGIAFSVSGGYLQQLSGLDAYGPAELYVAAADADDARGVLANRDRPA